MKGPPCSECGREAYRTDGAEIYPHRPDLHHKIMWACICGAYCGSHENTGEPLGYPCGWHTRQARMAAHEAFDRLWKHGPPTRPEAYAWLAHEMGLPPEQCHIGMMTEEQARRVVQLAKSPEGRKAKRTGEGRSYQFCGTTDRTSDWAGTPSGPDDPPWDP